MNIPSSTYRIQLHKNFTFVQLEEILDYLHQLGISTIYASPITAAFKGSQHGYDVTNPQIVNPEIGTEADLAKLTGLLAARNMTWLQDIVPNHMAYVSDNNWLWDVLQRGEKSEYYSFFDTNTKDAQELTGPRIMAPFLGKTLTECLQNKEINLQFQPDGLSTGGFVLNYYDNLYPVAIPSWQWIVTVAEGCPPALLSSLQQLEAMISEPAAVWTAAKEQWIRQAADNPEWRSFLQQRVAFFNEQPALLAELVNNQHYILTHAHLAASRINYRRFFTVNSLICLRMEDPAVFSAYHTAISRWVKQGYIQGVRIDHIDGLAFPRRYLTELKQLLGQDCYVVAEKIQAANEPLPENWQLEGTSGYDFLAMVNQLLTDETGYRELISFYRDKIDRCPAYEEIVFSKKISFLQTQMGGEWDNLLGVLISQPLPGLDNLDKVALKQALGILMASFPVYRTYPEGIGNSGAVANPDVKANPEPAAAPQSLQDAVSPKLIDDPAAPQPAAPISDADRNVIDQAFSNAAARYPAEGSRELNFLKDLFRTSGVFQARLMQFTGPLAAKGIEDTTFYVYNPLISRNEVGDNPSIESLSAAEFHQAMTHRQQHLPYSMNATATHDTKRGEDARIRLNWLTAIPEEWIARVEKWQQINRTLIAPVPGAFSRTPDTPSSVNPAAGRMPTANDEYLIYQALLGSFPEDLVVTDAYRERFHQYLTKALREAKTNTGYDKPNETYESKCHDFVTAILEQQSAFLEDFIPFAYKIVRESNPYTLSQTLLKLTAPGIPDIYQGAESWDLSLVDPDNRLPVDYAARKKMLTKIQQGQPIKDRDHQGAGKLFIIHQTLTYRNQYPQVFTAGAYIPVTVPEPLIAYLRRHEDDWALVILPLIRKGRPIPKTLSITLPAEAPSDWTNLFTGQKEFGSRAAKDGDNGITLEVKGILSEFPVALLVGQSS